MKLGGGAVIYEHIAAHRKTPDSLLHGCVGTS